MKRVWKIVAVFFAILVVAVLASVVHHFQLRAATNAYIAELKAKGEPMDPAQVLPPPLSPQENGADILREARALFKTDPNFHSGYTCMRMVAPGRAMACSKQPDARDLYIITNSWDDVETAVARNSDSFGLLRQIIEKPAFDFQIHYWRGFDHLDFTNMYVVEFKEAALRLETAALSDLHRGDPASAVNDLRATLAIVKAMRGEHLLISELVRIAITAIAVSGTWEVLQSTNVTDEQLAALQKDWANLEFFHSMEMSLEMERAISLITITQWRGRYSEFESQLMEESPLNARPKISILDRLRIRSHIFQWRYWWSYPDELRGDEFFLGAMRAAQTNDALLSIQSELQSNISKLSIPTNENTYFWSADPATVNLHFSVSDSVLSLPKTFNRVIRTVAATRIIVTAIALKRYQLKHAEYPESLSALTPEFLPAVPRDPIDGKPLRYRRNSDGSFALYSIGDDGEDNGGDPTPSASHEKSLSWQNGRDWVWPQPATAEEIRNFDAHPPK